ncbi:MAG: VanW family protein [Lachnospiraceae bacterium]
MLHITPQPKKRSDLRLFFGRIYYTFCRYGLWYLGGIKFSKIREEIQPYLAFTHTTPMLRKLKDVDMYLQYNKITNLKIAANKLDKITLRPGETFSYWKAIGRPSRRKGYVKGMVLKNGGYLPGTGGGLCQMSNLIYWMTIHTPLTVTERHRHGYDVFPDSNRTQPFGSGATCFYNYGDLMIVNNTDDVFQLHISFDNDYLVGEWRAGRELESTYEVYEKEHLMQPEYWGGYTRHNMIYRRKFDRDGNLEADEYVVENHAIMMYSPFIEYQPEAANVSSNQ